MQSEVVTILKTFRDNSILYFLEEFMEYYIYILCIKLLINSVK